jgi:P27 family predicted phage terminase small subunit
MKGRPSKSEAEHKATGTFRPDRHGSRLKASESEILKPPAHFNKVQIAKWNEVVNHLRQFDILSDQDADSIATYVESVLIQRDAFLLMQREGFLDGEKTHPAFRVYRDMEAVIKPLREQFGFTPRARQSIHVKKKEVKKEDPILAILTKPKKAV